MKFVWLVIENLYIYLRIENIFRSGVHPYFDKGTLAGVDLG